MITDPVARTGPPQGFVSRRIRPPLEPVRRAQRDWAARGVTERLEVVRRFRGRLAGAAETIAARGPASRTDAAETLTAEVLPLLEACRWLERNAEDILAPRPADGSSPAWLGRAEVTVHRDPHGIVLLIAAGNYPIFLPGVQILQALAAGNAVVVKPGVNGAPAARSLQGLLVAAGLDPTLCVVLDESPAAASWAIERGVDKVVLTGSAQTGRAILSQLAHRLTPATMELSGADAVYVLPGADLDLVASELAFGTTLNGGATCIAPRRVFVPPEAAEPLARRLTSLLEGEPPIELSAPVAGRARRLIEEALRGGGRLVVGGPPLDGTMVPTVLTDVPVDSELVGADLFAPVLVLETVESMDEALASSAAAPYALGASVFGPVPAARKLAARIDAGTVVVNDLIVPTADPRVPFAARRQSGFGVTRGAEGLLELTRIRTVIVRSGRARAHLRRRPRGFEQLLLGYALAVHATRLEERLRGLGRLLRAALRARRSTRSSPGASGSATTEETAP